MPVDTSIYSNIQPFQPPNQLNQLAAIGQIQASQNQNRLADLQFQQAQRGIEQENKLNELWANPSVRNADGSTNVQNLISGAASAGLGSKIPALQKGLAESQKAQAEAQKATLDNHAQQLALIGQVMGGVQKSGGQGYQSAVQYLRSAIPGGGQDLPDQYDPAIVDRVLSQALTAQQQVEKLQKDLDYQLKVRQQTETERNNKAQNAVAQGNLGVAQGQLGVARDRLKFDQSQPKGVYDKESGIIVDQRTGKSIPVTDQNGQPIQGGGGKMTEDQGKATGWLIQAENAYKNIKDAIKSNPSALKPGVNDLIASVPSFGFSEVVANNLRGADRQRVLQGTSALSEALLRAATGAGVNESEARQKVNELTPVSGDSDAVIAQKMASIPLYIDSLKVRAGPGAKKAAEVLSKQPAKPATSSDGWSVTEVK